MNCSARVLLGPLVFFAATVQAAYVLPESKRVAFDGNESDAFGWSIAVDGSHAVISADGSNDQGLDSGAVYLMDTATGTLTSKLTPDDGEAGDSFGWNVGLRAATAIVGAPHDDDLGFNAGSAYLFDASTGEMLHKLTASDGQQGDLFGVNVAVDGNLALVGASNRTEQGSRAGAAYLFDVTTGLQLAKLVPDDSAENGLFGGAVALSGNRALVGAYGDGEFSGAAYLFDTTTGAQLAKLTPNDAAANDYFGFSLAIEGDLALIGAFGDDDNGHNSGAAYLFDALTGEQRAKLVAIDGAAGDGLGRAVALSGPMAMLGAYWDSDQGDRAGSAYVFEVASTAQVAKLVARDGQPDDFFGESVALSGSTAIVGAWGDDTAGATAGAVYLIDLDQVVNVPEPATVVAVSWLSVALVMARRGSTARLFAKR
ncbi:FG-GAP repeat protein [Aeoliella mucimassa]|uniref:FG-GAP repeat protein n=1 Tax=Aeoliella mucimassa TaxID=2527972 RepID=A0A518AKP4_9BACT|nr:FG-GAP repeat protein [Aeoliella mucimassa]QDU55292.1 hypothetical protein Pan181_14810 [Aeoliella mucimassa]